ISRWENAPCYGAQLEGKQDGPRDVEVPAQHVDHNSVGVRVVSASVVELVQRKGDDVHPFDPVNRDPLRLYG
ncbi:hypothetical protein B8W95_14095, partial [Staphylococcus pasteuri]